MNPRLSLSLWLLSLGGALGGGGEENRELRFTNVINHLYNLQKPNQWSPPPQGADIFKIHVKSRRIVKLTEQIFTPNTGAANWADDFRTPREGRTHYEYGVFNLGPCPLPGGRIVFTSNRDGFVSVKDRQGNTSRIERTFSIGPTMMRASR